MQPRSPATFLHQNACHLQAECSLGYRGRHGEGASARCGHEPLGKLFGTPVTRWRLLNVPRQGDRHDAALSTSEGGSIKIPNISQRSCWETSAFHSIPIFQLFKFVQYCSWIVQLKSRLKQTNVHVDPVKRKVARPVFVHICTSPDPRFF